MKIGSLFAGIGGFDLAARWVGWETAWFSEVHPYACKVLEKNFPGVPNHGDITQIDFTQVEPVEVLCGGFPCQDISLAGKGAGIDGSRSGLWSHYARAIGELRPRYVVVENVAALLGRGLDRVIGDLAALGYDAEWHCIPAASVGAPHRRDRIWVVGYPSGGGWGRESRRGAGPVVADRHPQLEEGAVAHTEHRPLQAERGERPSLAGQGRGGHADGGRGPSNVERKVAVRGAGEGAPEGVVDTLGERGCGWHRERKDAEDAHTPGEGVRSVRNGGWWSVEPDVGRVANGVPARVDRLTGLGNAIVPQVAEVIFRAIQEKELT